ncbi:MAG: RNA-binding S4 domain-containing protein [Lachnospiraceae bacterium]|nr:RNA-binding S4 domain-containing protein [Lachnospiraceae bacterium]
METFVLKDDFIKLGQLMKAANMVSNGSDAKFCIQDGLVKVNGEVTLQRGKKIVAGDVVEYRNMSVKVE